MKTRSWSPPSTGTADNGPQERPLLANEKVVFSSRHTGRPVVLELLGAGKMCLACIRERDSCSVEREDGDTLFTYDGENFGGNTEFQNFLVALDHYWVKN